MSNRDIIHHLRQVYGTELYEFLTDKVGALPGVQRVETAPVIRTVKQASPIVVPVKLKPATICPNGPCIPLVWSGRSASRRYAVSLLGPAPILNTDPAGPPLCRTLADCRSPPPVGRCKVV
jgi:hypothetical protein